LSVASGVARGLQPPGIKATMISTSTGKRNRFPLFQSSRLLMRFSPASNLKHLDPTWSAALELVSVNLALAAATNQRVCRYRRCRCRLLSTMLTMFPKLSVLPKN
jgi:hypothetical protein